MESVAQPWAWELAELIHEFAPHQANANDTDHHGVLRLRSRTHHGRELRS